MKRVLFDSDVILDVLTQRQPHFPTSAFEDAVTHEAAIAANVDVMVTRNIDDFRNATLLILLPEIFLETL